MCIKNQVLVPLFYYHFLWTNSHEIVPTWSSDEYIIDYSEENLSEDYSEEDYSEETLSEDYSEYEVKVSNRNTKKNLDRD